MFIISHIEYRSQSKIAGKAGIMPAEGIILSGVSFRDETVIGWPSGESLRGGCQKVKAGHSSRESLKPKG